MKKKSPETVETVRGEWAVILTGSLLNCKIDNDEANHKEKDSDEKCPRKQSPVFGVSHDEVSDGQQNDARVKAVVVTNHIEPL